MGLLLLVPGLVLLLNQTTWFSGEDAVGRVLVGIGAVILLIQLLWTLFVAAKVRSKFRDFDSSFDRRF